MSEARTAILFFSHRPEREWQNKWFVRRDYAKNRQVAEAFYQQARQAVAESGLPVLEVSSPQQRGASFGARLANAVADAFDEGYDRVIAVGSDCPTLHQVNWAAVAGWLEAGRPVLGPTVDEKGAYLIGITRAQFERDSFAALPWQSSDLLAALALHLNATAAPTPVRLAARADINDHGELVRLLRSSSSAALLQRLRHVLGDALRRDDVIAREAARSSLERRSRAPPSARRSSHV